MDCYETFDSRNHKMLQRKRCSVNNSISKQKKVLFRVLQGPILGQLLLNSFLNDVCNSVTQLIMTAIIPCIHLTKSF